MLACTVATADSQLLPQLPGGIAVIRSDGTWQKIDDRWMGR